MIKMNTLVGLMLVAGSVAACGGSNQALFDEQVDCLSLDPQEQKVAKVNWDAQTKIAAINECSDKLEDYRACSLDKGDCNEKGKNNVWDEDGKCNDEIEDYNKCIE